MDHAAIRELAAGAALDDLDAMERRALDAHLGSCPSCRHLGTDLRDVLGELALAAPELRPPSGLLASVLTALREPAEPSLTLVTDASPLPRAAAGPLPTPMSRGGASSAAGRSRRAVPRWSGYAVAAILAVVAVGLASEVARLDGRIRADDVALSGAAQQLAERQAAVTVAADPNHRTATLGGEAIAPDARAVVVYRPGRPEAYLLANGLPATPAGHVYQLWVADDAGVHALGTYAFDGRGPFIAPFGIDMEGRVAAMVTLEPIGGSAGEPGPQVVFGEL